MPFEAAPVAIRGRQRDQDLPRRVVEQVGEPDLALPLGGAAPADGQQPREPSVGGAVARQAEHAGRVGEVEPCADDQLHVDLPRGRVGAHHAGERVAVGHRDRVQAERGSRPHQLPGMRGAAEEGEVGRHLELGIGRGHANSPWMNQAGGASEQ